MQKNQNAFAHLKKYPYVISLSFGIKSAEIATTQPDLAQMEMT